MAGNFEKNNSNKSQEVSVFEVILFNMSYNNAKVRFNLKTDINKNINSKVR